MRDVALAALLILTAAAPLLAAVVTVAAGKLIPRARIHWPAVAGSGVTLAAAIVLWVLLPESGTIPDSPFILYRWITLPTDAVSVTVGLQLDAVSALILLASALATWVVVLHACRMPVRDSTSPGFFAALSMLQFASVMLLLATDFFQLFCMWQLTAVIAFLLKGSHTRAQGLSLFAESRFVWNRVADVALLTAAFLTEIRFETFDLRAAVDAAESVSGSGDADLVSLLSISLCLLFAAAARCGQFPLRVGRDDSDQTSGSTSALIEAALFMPAGVYLIVRLFPLLAASSVVMSGMMCIGGLSALAGSISAAAQTDPKRMLSAATTSLFGLMFLGLGTGSPTGVAAALLLLAVHMLATTSLFIAVGDVPASKTSEKPGLDVKAGFLNSRSPACWIFLTAAIVLCSGMWGQNALLTAAWSIAQQSSSGDSFTVLVIAYWSAMTSLLFLAFAMARGVYSAFQSGDRVGRREEREAAIALSLPWLLPIAAAVAGPLLVGSTEWFDGLATTTVSDRNVTDSTSLMQIDFGLLLVFLGVIAAWLGNTQTVTLPPQAAGIFRPIVTWARSGYGLDGFWTAAINLPIRSLSWLCGLVDRYLIDAVATKLPIHLLSLPARAAEPLRNGLVQFYALSVLLATALLLVVLTWLRG